jgi:hypothetical protein
LQASPEQLKKTVVIMAANHGDCESPNERLLFLDETISLDVGNVTF